MSFIQTAYQPQGRVTDVIAGEGILQYEQELLRLGVKTLKTAFNQRFSTTLGSHSDLFINYLGNGKILLDFSQSVIEEELRSLGLKTELISESVTQDYPNDCLLNSVVENGRFIGKYDTACVRIKDYAEKHNFKIINTHQGYAKCSLLTVTKNAYITDDISIFKSLKKSGSDVLLIEKGSVRLKGFNYGFIGGCSGKISSDTIAFCGKIKKHKSFDNIKAFCNNYNINLLSLGSEELEDIGSIIPVCEE